MDRPVTFHLLPIHHSTEFYNQKSFCTIWMAWVTAVTRAVAPAAVVITSLAAAR